MSEFDSSDTFGTSAIGELVCSSVILRKADLPNRHLGWKADAGVFDDQRFHGIGDALGPIVKSARPQVCCDPVRRLCLFVRCAT